HRAHGGEAAGGRGARARRHGLLVLLARLAQMHVQVDEAGADDFAGGVEHPRTLRDREALADALDAIALQQHVLHCVHRGRGVDHAAVLDEQAHACSPVGRGELTPPSRSPRAPASNSKTPIRTATPLATWSRMTEYGPSATSGESSTPRFTGPGCMIST